MKVAVTGHRLERIKGKEQEIRKWLLEQIQILVKNNNEVILIDGMAEGVDQIAAATALNNGAQLSCYFPYRKKLYGIQAALAEKAAEVRFLYDEYWDGCYIERDYRMVDDCDVLIVVWDGKPWGGTYYTYQYALDRNRKIIMFPWRNKVEVDWDALEQGYNDYASEDDEDEDEWD